MTKKLSFYALISSPLLALYGVVPFYIFKVFSLENSIQIFFAILFTVFFYWVINGYLFFKVNFKKKIYAYILSYVGAFSSRIFFLLFRDAFGEFRDTLAEYLFYPVVITLAVNTIILIIINSIKKEQEKQQAYETISELTIQNLTAQKRTLLQQLQPHFLFNALSILKSLIQEDAQLAENYSVKLSDFLRYSVEAHSTELVLVKDEMKFVQDYIDLQQIRFEESFTFTADLPVHIQNEKVPVFAIQTLVENAFKHNYFTNKKPLHISVTYQDECLKVCNNIGSIKLTERAGTGLANLKKRYELFGQTTVEITKTENQFCVQIPIIKP